MRTKKSLKALDKLDNTLCLNANRKNIEFNIDEEEHIDCKDFGEMIECIETIKKDLNKKSTKKKSKSEKRDVLFKDIRDLLDYYVWEAGYYVGDKNGHRICQVFGYHTTFRNKELCDFLDNSFTNKVLMNARVIALGNDYCILDVELPHMEGKYEHFQY